MPLPFASTFLSVVESVATAVEQLVSPGAKTWKRHRAGGRDGAAEGGDVVDLVAHGRRRRGLGRDGRTGLVHGRGLVVGVAGAADGGVVRVAGEEGAPAVGPGGVVLKSPEV